MGEVYGNSNFADFPFNVDNIWKENSSQATNKTESQYLTKTNTQIAEFSVVTPEQFKNIKPVDTAILRLIPNGDLDLTAYLSELIRSERPENQTIIFWFSTP